jgi:hypothetical protein
MRDHLEGGLEMPRYAAGRDLKGLSGRPAAAFDAWKSGPEAAKAAGFDRE